MKPLPQSQVALVICTDFSDQEAWEAIGGNAAGGGATIAVIILR